MKKMCNSKVLLKEALTSLAVWGLLAANNGETAATAVLHRNQVITPHSSTSEWSLSPTGNHATAGYGFKHEVDNDECKQDNSKECQAFVEEGVGKQKFVGVFEHEYIMAYSQSLQRAFKKSSKFTHSLLFLKELFSTNPFLKFFAVRYSERGRIVDTIERAGRRWKLLGGKDKAVAAEEAMAKMALRRAYTMGRSLVARKAYAEHRRDLLASLREVNAGGHALDLILGRKSKPLFTWTNSLWKNPLATMSNIVEGAFQEAFDGIVGIPSEDIKGSCFSFGYRINSIAPYTAVFPGGIFGSILKSLTKAYILVFYPFYASFRGVFSLMIGVICKTRVIRAAKKIVKMMVNVTRLGLRGVRILMRRFAVRDDPVAWPLLYYMLKRGSPALITLLFQLYAINLRDITEGGKRVDKALAAGTAAWNYGDGLWVGAVDFGRAFHKIVKKYMEGVQALLDYCESIAPRGAEETGLEQALLQMEQEEAGEGEEPISGSRPEELAEGASPAEPEADERESLLNKAFEAIAPGATASPEEARQRLAKVCRRRKSFLNSYKRNPAPHVQRMVHQMVKVLKYDYRYFAGYVGEMVSIFYETAQSLLNADVASVLNEKLSPDAMGERLQAALLKHQMHREAAIEVSKSSIPRKFLRMPWFRSAGILLAHGFFESAAGLSLYHALRDIESEEAHFRRNAEAFKLLQKGTNDLRKSVTTIFGQFLSSRIMMTRLEGNSSVKTVKDFITKCNPRLGVPDPEVCGTVETSEVDPDSFVADALFATHLPMATSPDDLAVLSEGNFGTVFQQWQQSSRRLSKTDRAIASKASDTASMKGFLDHVRRALMSRLVFSRFEFTRGFTALILHDTNGRSVLFTPDNPDAVRALGGRSREAGASRFRPNPLDTYCWFHLDHENWGALQFTASSGTGEEAEGLGVASGPAAPAAGTAAYSISGRVEYRDAREELATIKNDPSALRDVLVAKFVDTYGRATAEMMASLLILLHSKTPSFWSQSPSIFMQNMTPKMFFDACHALAATSRTAQTTGVMLENRLYSFPFNFATLKGLLLGAVNRMILRLHSLDSKDMVSVFIVTVTVMAYQRIQKHRTGKTLIMNLFLRDVLHLTRASRGEGGLLGEAPYCAWLEKDSKSREELIIKCSALRFFKLGSVNVIEEQQKEKVRLYLQAFFDFLDRVRGRTGWMDFLNARTFAAEADMYARTAARYSYEDLVQQLEAEQDTSGHDLMGELHKNIHPALGGPREFKKEKKELVTALRSYAENIKQLPQSLRKGMQMFVDACHGKLRRLVGAKQFRWLQSIRPNVMHASTFFAAMQGAEGLVFPEVHLPRELFIEALDLAEYGALQLVFEELAMVLSDAQGIHDIIVELRSIPTQTVEAREEYLKLKARIEKFPVPIVETAVGWALRYISDGKGGLDVALGLLALKSTDPAQLSKALHLSYANTETLRFLNSALSVAVVLDFLPKATNADLAHLRIALEGFRAAAQTEPRSTAMDFNRNFPLEQSVVNVVEALERLEVASRADLNEVCAKLLSENPEIFSEGSLSTRTLRDPVVLCYLLTRFTRMQAGGAKTFSPMQLSRETLIDGKAVDRHLRDITNTSIKMEVRVGISNRLTPFFRGLLTAASEHRTGPLGAAQVASVDLRTGVISFIVTTAVEFSSGGPGSVYTPAQVFSHVARMAFGAENVPAELGPAKVASATVSYPPSLEDWYSFANAEELERLTDAALEGSVQLTGAVLSKVSAANAFADLTDYFFGLRQSSPIAPRAMVAGAVEYILSSGDLRGIEKFGVAVLVADFERLAEQMKIECLQNAMENVATYLGLTLQRKHLFQYDCFVNRMAGGWAAPGAARYVKPELIDYALSSIDNTYGLKAQDLYESLLKNPKRLVKATEMGQQYVQRVPTLALGYAVAREILLAVNRRLTWGELLMALMRLKERDWEIPEETPIRKRIVNKMSRPKFFNLMQMTVDCLLFMLTGRFDRVRLPRALPVKRLKALIKRFGRRLRTAEQAEDKKVRRALAQRLGAEIAGLQGEPEAARGRGPQLEGEGPPGPPPFPEGEGEREGAAPEAEGEGEEAMGPEGAAGGAAAEREEGEGGAAAEGAAAGEGGPTEGEGAGLSSGTSDEELTTAPTSPVSTEGETEEGEGGEEEFSEAREGPPGPAEGE